MDIKETTRPLELGTHDTKKKRAKTITYETRKFRHVYSAHTQTKKICQLIPDSHRPKTKLEQNGKPGPCPQELPPTLYPYVQNNTPQKTNAKSPNYCITW